MKKFALFILLASSFIYSCSSEFENPELTTESQLDSARMYQDFQDRIVTENSEDMDQLFGLYLGGLELVNTKEDLTENDLISFIENYKNLQFADFIQNLRESSFIEDHSLTEIETLFPEISRKTDVEERINFIQNLTDHMSIESSDQINMTNVILEGYNNILKYNLSSNISYSRDCTSDCIISNSYGFIWWYYHDWYKSLYPWACSSSFYCPQAASYANAMVANWCASQCAANQDPCLGVTCPQGYECVNGNCRDKCIGVNCIQGYKCVDGNCVEDPFYDGCDDCLPGEQCVNGRCIPW